MSRLLGYARVSTNDQNVDTQREILKEAGCEFIYSEIISGKDTDRTELQYLLSEIKEGDIVVITSLDRLARSVRDLLNLVETFDEKGVKLKSLKKGEDVIDPSTSTGKFMMTVLVAVADLERELIRERQLAGIAKAKAEGKYKGRALIETPDNFREVYERCYKLKDGDPNKITAAKAMEILKLKKSTFYRMCKEQPDYDELRKIPKWVSDIDTKVEDINRYKERSRKEQVELQVQLIEAQEKLKQYETTQAQQE